MQKTKKISIPFVYIVLIVMFVINIILNPNILSARGFNSLMIQLMPTIFVAMAQMSVMIAGEINLAMDGIINIVIITIALTMGYLGALSLVFATVVGVGIGIVMSLIITKFKISSFIVTLAFGMIFNGFALLLMPRPGGDISKTLATVIKGNPIVVPNSLLILIGTLLLWKLFKKSRYGLHMYAVGGNEYSAFTSGINVHKSKMMAYICSSLFIVAAAIVLCGKSLMGDPTIGDGFPLTSVSGAVLGGALFSGGVGTMKGAIAGGALMAILLNILFFLNVDSAYQYIAQGAILFASIAFTMAKSDKKQ